MEGIFNAEIVPHFLTRLSSLCRRRAASAIFSCPAVVAWLERVLHVLPVAQRPQGYDPLGTKNLDPDWIEVRAAPAGIASTPSPQWTLTKGRRTHPSRTFLKGVSTLAGPTREGV